MYTGVFLKDVSRNQLVKWASSQKQIVDLLGSGYQMNTASGEQLIDHVTLHLGRFNPKLNDINLLGQPVTFEISTLGISDKAIAFGVSYANQGVYSAFGTPLVLSQNATPHITIAINPKNGGKPMHSNQIDNWTKIPTMTIQGVLLEK